MADGSESGDVSIREHLDISIVMLLLIAAFVFAIGAVGRYVGNSLTKPGVTAFFNG